MGATHFTTFLEFEDKRMLANEISDALGSDWRAMPCSEQSGYLTFRQNFFLIYPGLSGWSVVKAWPRDLMLRPVVTGKEPLVAQIAKQVNCYALHLALIDDTQIIVVEADRDGRYRACGAAEPPIVEEGEEAVYRFHGVRIEQFDISFELAGYNLQGYAASLNEDPYIGYYSLATWLAGNKDHNWWGDQALERIVKQKTGCELSNASFLVMRSSKGINTCNPL